MRSTRPPEPPQHSAPSFFYADTVRNRKTIRGQAGGDPPKRRNWFSRLLIRLVLLGVIAAVLIGGGLAGWFILTLPDPTQMAEAAKPVRRPSVTLRAADGSLLATYGDLPGDYLHLADMPKALPQAVIATEDRRFYSHFGIDPWGLLRAIFTDLRARETLQGGSTITQQLAKNLYLSSERSLTRKLHEAVIAIWLERHFSKDQLLEMYLNRVYFGSGTFGVDSAAHRYFAKSARSLSTYQCALLAGLLKAPSHFNPANDRKAAADRTNLVLANMVDAGFLTPEAARSAAAESKKLISVPTTQSGARYFADWVQDQLAALKYTGDVTVETTIDPTMQVAAEAAVARTLDREGASYNVKQAALVAMTPDGAVRAMVGGRDYGTSPFNRATQAQRQPGSAFKLFVYLAALEHGISPDDHYVDRPLRIGKWQIHDYKNKYLGDVSVREAVAESINTVAVQVMMRTGVSNVIAMARRLGITGDLPADTSLALGTGDVTLIKLTGAYATLANAGVGLFPYGVVSVQDSTGRTLYTRQDQGPGRVLSHSVVGQMTSMLEGVIDHGTGRAAALGRPEAGKTGTTSDFRDALFVGFTADLVAGVWFGNDDNTPMNDVSGGKLPARTWHDFMKVALAHTPSRPLPGYGGGGEDINPEAAATDGGQSTGQPTDAIGSLIDGIFGSSKEKRNTGVASRPSSDDQDDTSAPNDSTSPRDEAVARDPASGPLY